MTLKLPVTSQALELARQFSQQQPTPAKQERVNLNTLAICAVNNYLEMMGFQTNLQGGDSWNAIARLGANVSDLVVDGIGKIECIPVQPGETVYSIPAEVWLDRVAYLFVEINVAERQATLRGFIPQAQAQVRPDQLRSLEDLIDRLHGSLALPVVRLDRWLEGLEDTLVKGWQSIESLFATPELAFRSVLTPSRSDVIQKGKIIDLGVQLQGNPIALVVEISPLADTERTQIRLRVCPVNQSYLLSDIELMVIDDYNQVFLEAKSRESDNLIQLEFTGEIGERFMVVVKLGGSEVIERFTI